MNTNKPRHRWYQFSLQAMLIVMIVASAVFGYWVHWSKEWISQRHEAFSSERFGTVVYATGDPPISPPASLWLFGEQGIAIVLYENTTPENLIDLQRLFPEAEVGNDANQMSRTTRIGKVRLNVSEGFADPKQWRLKGYQLD